MPDLAPFHEELTWMTPLSEARADRLIEFVAEAEPRLVLDIGCGWAELLLRVLSASPSSTARGADLDGAAIERGRSEARRRGLDARLELVVGDAGALAGPANAVLCIGSSQVWGPSVEEAQPWTTARRVGPAPARPSGRPPRLRRGDLVAAPDRWGDGPIGRP